MPASPVLDDLLSLTRDSLPPVQALVEAATARVRSQGGDNQSGAHGLAWLATYAQALTQMHDWAGALDELGEMEALLLQIAFGEYLWQIYGGIPMSQNEIIRLQDIGLTQDEQRGLMAPAVMELCQSGNTQAARSRLAELMCERSGAVMFGASGLGEELDMIRDQFRRFAVERVIPHAHGWHLADELIPEDVIEGLAEMGVFGLTIPEEFGGLGLSKASMCVVSEELSRGYIGVGSLATRSEIAAELILGAGTDAQKAHWLPRIANGEVLPTAVFSEPSVGSDLGALRCRGVRDGADWAITGNKTWITHAGRASMMTLLARTDLESDDYRGLSMFIAQKTPQTEGAIFPDDGLEGSEIGVLGYRGMKEYELAFDGFHVAGEGLLGGETGRGFKQLMQTFEAARIQTAARAIGVAQNALDLGLDYAQGRVQFGQPLTAFPRISGKLAMMAVEIMIARQLTYHSARQKDGGARCDLEAGMAKLLAARVAWASADGAVQIHGGNGFALEYPISRVLCDARILNIFEGAAEIQATVIARRLIG